MLLQLCTEKHVNNLMDNQPIVSQPRIFNRLLSIALKCTEDSHTQRPEMVSVLRQLEAK